MNTATLVEETLRGLPDKITVYIPWDPELEEPGLWEDWPGELVNQFPCAYLTHEECDKAIAEFMIDTLEAVLRNDMTLPSSIDYAHKYTLSRGGNMHSDDGYSHTMFDLVSEHESGTEQFTKQTFNREFAHYYAGLVAQQRNKQ